RRRGFAPTSQCPSRVWPLPPPTNYSIQSILFPNGTSEVFTKPLLVSGEMITWFPQTRLGTHFVRLAYHPRAPIIWDVSLVVSWMMAPPFSQESLSLLEHLLPSDTQQAPPPFRLHHNSLRYSCLPA